MSKHYKLEIDSPIGVIEILGNDDVVQSILFVESEGAIENQHDIPAVLLDCRDQLIEYFQGVRQTFTFPFQYSGTPFQHTVWNSLVGIPFAETASYRDIAITLQKEKAVRAVGNANGKNKLSIVVPCHRIIGSSGSLTGYAGGLWRKEWLLHHEKTVKETRLV
ncbi:methylated-DNA--[protein]-cysteine S-methyltransferase [Fictibacillus norfolkensis]|uniref:Methylated-DNA--[protein]-cysteine S-methyltransferase n=1 Tax=Fictibacillus norfolkensis TaxID=2762233 RepID=A0ABR8SJH5_9BACL|nr:methylated-DNA--[protein]-cysteine S-methyltransferase [Fictibacillus norfolkensis]MBD7963640.1 methylated-DNA--[protein]-cysteine S-methyltransferase [Fictibacillus norfolkensis]